MKTSCKNAKNGHRFTNVLTGVAWGLLLMIVVSCAGSTAYFSNSNDVSRQFETGEILPGYRYYYGGPQLKPNAIVAINPDYTLESPHWHAMKVSPASLQAIIDTIKFVPDAEYKTTPNGARIFASDGALVGVWYSVFEHPLVKRTGNNQVYLAAPQPILPFGTRIRIHDRD
ncbi:hypothetical protein DESC_770177 [Desulfosarcina cetonica]|nr:hypothetical protein DESC_770177 [Desulfosarcina cetonica]